MSKIRVLRVITRMNIGGPAIQAALLTARLDPRRFQTLLVTGQEGSSEGNILRLGRLQVHVEPILVPELGRRVAPLDDLRALVRVTQIARAFRPDVVHTHLAKAGFVGRVAGRLAGARAIVHTYHGSVFSGYFGRYESAAYMGIERCLARLTTRVIAITPRQEADLKRLRITTAARIVQIPLGFELAAFADAPDRATARRELGLPEAVPLVALVARLVPVKDVPTFLRALAILARSIPTVQALIVGDGEDRIALEGFAKELGIWTRCRFLGWRADMPSVYAAVDLVALSSINEGAPVSVIEAMASGRAVVATEVGGVPDVVLHEETGLLVRPGNPAAMAAALARLLKDEHLRVTYGRAARGQALARFDLSRLVADVEGLYLGMLSLKEVRQF